MVSLPRTWGVAGSNIADIPFSPGLLQHGTPEMDGVPGVTQVGLHIPSEWVTLTCSSIQFLQAAISHTDFPWETNTASTGTIHTFGHTTMTLSADRSLSIRPPIVLGRSRNWLGITAQIWQIFYKLKIAQRTSS